MSMFMKKKFVYKQWYYLFLIMLKKMKVLEKHGVQGSCCKAENKLK